MAKVMLGELLVGAGLVTEDEVLAAVRAQRGSGLPLGHYLVRSGTLSEDELLRVLSQQIEVPIIDLDRMVVSEDAAQKVPAEYARANLVVPYRLDGRTLLVATADPTREDVVDHLRVASRCDVRLSLSTSSAIDRALDRAYGGRPSAAGATAPRGTAAPALGAPEAGGDRLDARVARLETAISTLVERLTELELFQPGEIAAAPSPPRK